MRFSDEKATVSHVDGDFVFLETQGSATCSNCSNKTGCGQISSIFTFKPKNKLKINNTLGLKEGDSVLVGMASGKLLKATVLMYVLPLVLLMFFSFFAKLLIGEVASIIAGLAGLLTGLLVLKLYAQQINVLKQFQPKLIRKIINIDIV